MNQTSITLLDYALLSLLKEESRSGYALRKVFTDTSLGNFSGSPGSIYPALKRLKVGKYVKQEGHHSGNYSITDKGSESLRIWLQSDISSEDVKKNLDELLLRFSMMDIMASREDKIRFIQNMKSKVDEHLIELNEYYVGDGQELKESAKMAYQHTIFSYLGTLKWCKNILAQLNLNEN